MTVTFKYGEKQYTTNNLEKKLKRLGILESDIVICKNGTGSEKYEEEIVVKKNGYPYFFWNSKYGVDGYVSGTGYTECTENVEHADWDKDWILIIGEPIFPLEQDENTGLPKVKAYESN